MSDGRITFSPIDNEALARWFTHLSKTSPEEKTRLHDLLEQALKGGKRPAAAVKEILGPINSA